MSPAETGEKGGTMRSVSKRVQRMTALLALCTILGAAPGAFASPRADNADHRWRNVVEQIRHFIVKAFDAVTEQSRLGWPPG